MLLGPSLVWLGVIYLGSLAVLLATAFWHYDSFTFSVDPGFTLENFREVVTGDIYRTVTARTILMAASVTIADALLALPLAFYIAKLAGNRMKAALLVLVLMPLWSSYLVKSYAWRLILSDGGVLAWALSPLGLGSPGFGNVAVFIGLTYLWLPFMILPLVAGFERIPGTMLEASSDLGARGWQDTSIRRLPPARPGPCSGLDLHLLAHDGRLHRRRPARFEPVHRLADLLLPGRVGQRAARGRTRLPAADRHDPLPVRGQARWSVRRAMNLSPSALRILRALSLLTIAFIWMPLFLVALYAFNRSKTSVWPPPGLSLTWFGKAIRNPGAREAFILSIEIALVASLIAVVLGTMLAFAVHRHRFFGRNVVSFLIILPIALPGIVTGLALQASFKNLFGGLSLATVIIAHSTFCVVVVYNNAVARLRRTGGSFMEASADLGARPTQTFRHVTFPLIRSALLAGALLAFALSFDEIIVTTFTIAGGSTLPIWILNNFSRPNQLPIVNVVALLVIILSAIPVYLAQRLSADSVSSH